MSKRHIRKIGIILTAIMLVAGCSNVDAKNETELETAPVEQSIDDKEEAQTDSQDKEEAFSIDKETYTYSSDILTIDLKLPVVKRGDQVDVDSTRVLQKPFRDEINRMMTDADYWAGREEAFEPRHLSGDFEIIYEDDLFVSLQPQIKDNEWISAVTLQKSAGLSLGFEDLPQSEAFWTVVNDQMEKLAMDPIDIASRKSAFDHYYVTEEDLVFSIPKWMIGESGIQTFNVPLEVLNMTREDFLVGGNDIMNIGSKQHVVSTPYYTFAGEIPVFESETNPEFAKELTDLMDKQIVMNQKVIEDDAKDVYDSNVEDGFVFPPEIHNVQFDVKRSDSKYISIYITYYSYTGGAHGTHYDLVYTFDLEAQERIELQDLFKSDADYVSLINEKIEGQIQALREESLRAGGEDWSPYDGFETIAPDQHFYLTDDSIVIFFGLYEIAPYAAGIPMFEIPFSDLESVMK